MIAGLPLAFLNPWLLAALIALPALYYLLRLVPPRPRQVVFAPTRILFDIAPKEETPAKTPWWLTALRLAIAALVILAVSGPIWNPPVASRESRGPLLILVDDSFFAAPAFEVLRRTAGEFVDRAEADGRPVALVPLGPQGARDIVTMAPSAVRERLRTLAPVPHVLDRAAALPALERFVRQTPDLEVIWLADGVETAEGGAFVNGLKALLEGRPVTVFDGGIAPARGLTATDNAAGALSVKVVRADGRSPAAGIVRALDLRGLPLGEARFIFEGDATVADAVFDLPVEIRNDVARLDIVEERSAGAVQLLDKRWRRRAVGIVSGATADTAQPLLAATHYLTRALAPFADLRTVDAAGPSEAVSRLVDQRVPLMLLADVGTLQAEAREKLTRWVEAGGVLVRFAGPRLSAAAGDDLLPVAIRRGGRILGGALSWDQPQQLAGFSREGPFFGMPVPTDVTVTRQVLAEPDAALAERTYATLTDGTPLVTGAARGRGLVVLFHVTADTRWSDLPISGSFVDMLRRIVSLSGTAGPAAEATATGAVAEPIPASRLVDGRGQFTAPGPTARPLMPPAPPRATADLAPGFYGPPEGLVAVNALAPADRPRPLDVGPLGARREAYRLGEPLDLRAPLLGLGFLLFLADAVVMLVLGGGLAKLAAGLRPATRRAVLLIGLVLGAGTALGAADALAQSRPPPAPARPATSPPTGPEEFAQRSTLETRLAYVLTGDREVDDMSKAGLEGLTLFLSQRTALEPGEPVGLDLARDELAFFSVLYWPIVTGAERPAPEVLARVDAFMKNGGMVLFDTRDALAAPPGPGGEMNGPGMRTLRNILSSLDIPELEPVPREHVLTKAFFLLRDFPGRYASGSLWVEAIGAADEEDAEVRPARAGDGVSSILITSNDLAAAWAIGRDGQPLVPLVPGDSRQREMAFRAGVNIVMYALTGNYKADQVHIPALLERLGQ